MGRVKKFECCCSTEDTIEVGLHGTMLTMKICDQSDKVIFLNKHQLDDMINHLSSVRRKLQTINSIGNGETQ